MTTTRIDVLRARLREEAQRRGGDPRDVDVLFGRSTAWLVAHGDEVIDDESLVALAARRFAGEPLQYLVRTAHFYGREFYVDDRVLIPRPETELLVEAVLQRAPRGARIVDVGAGSGCIAITLQLERPDLRVTAVDRSLAALAVSRRNRDALGATVRLAASDVLTSVRAFDYVVSNPPYIRLADVEGLQIEVRDHEPHMALTPGPAGTEIIERLIVATRGLPLAMEIGYGQTDEVRALAAAHGRVVEAVLPDLAGIERVVVLSAHVD